MEFRVGQKVTVLEKNQPLFVETIADISDSGEIRLTSGEKFDRHGESKHGDLWQCAYLDECEEKDEERIRG